MITLGTNIAYFGANGLYWNTKYDKNIENIEVRKDNVNIGLLNNSLKNSEYLTPCDILKVTYNSSKKNKNGTVFKKKIKDHKLFNNISNDIFGIKSSSNYKGGINAWEVDDTMSCKKDKNENKKYIIADSDNGGEILYIDNGKYKIFSGSTILWNSAILIDEGINQLTLNVINDLLQ